MLAISSSDGFCSFMVFSDNKLGQIYEPTGELANLMNIQQFIPKQVTKTESTKETENARVEYR